MLPALLFADLEVVGRREQVVQEGLDEGDCIGDEGLSKQNKEPVILNLANRNSP